MGIRGGIPEGSPPLAGAAPGPEFVAVGHVARDRTPSGYRLGGTAAYAACTAARLGLRAALVTRAAPFVPLDALAAEVTVYNAGSPRSTTFENVYEGGQRRQYLHARAQPITSADMPESLRQAPIVLFGPVAQEMQPDLLDCARQRDDTRGWCRKAGCGPGMRTDWSGPCRGARAKSIRGRCEVLVFSVDDLQDAPQSLATWQRLAPFVVMTHGREGAKVYADARLIHRARAYRASEVDPTGAGDVFAAAFTIGLHQRGRSCLGRGLRLRCGRVRRRVAGARRHCDAARRFWSGWQPDDRVE